MRATEHGSRDSAPEQPTSSAGTVAEIAGRHVAPSEPCRCADTAPPPQPTLVTSPERRRRTLERGSERGERFFASCGLIRSDGLPKDAWTELLNQTHARQVQGGGA